MGLTISTRKQEWREGFHIGYGAFSQLRLEIVRAISQRGFVLCERWFYAGYIPTKYKPLSDDELKEINSIIPESLWLLLDHSDCDGKLTYKEARAIYNEIKNLKIETEHYKPIFDAFKNVLKHSFNARQNLYFN